MKTETEPDTNEIFELIERRFIYLDFQEGGNLNDEIINKLDSNGDIIPIIHYVEDVHTTKEEYEKIKNITHEELKAMKPEQLANMSMFEIVPDEYIRFYFDFDFVPYKWSNEKIPQIIKKVLYICDVLSETLGPYSYGGYTTNKWVSDKYGIRYYEQQNMKTLSLHVVFYESKVLRSDLYKSIDAIDYKKIMCDFSVYEPEGNRCLLRHIMTNKGLIKSYGFIAEGKTPDTQAITTNGNEKILSTDELIKAFKSIN